VTEVALGIDVGTGSTKAGLVDRAGRLLAVSRSPHPPAEPRPGWSEADPVDWLRAAGAATVDVLGRARGPVEVVAVGMSGQMHGVVVCGPDLDALRPAVLWSDRRSEADLEVLADRLGPELRARLANPVVAGMAGPSVAALRRIEPELFRAGAVRSVLQAKDWVRGRLTGSVATDPSDASATLLWDIPGDRWSAEAAAVFGVDPSWLAPVLGSSSVAGTLTAAGADLLGLPQGLAVATGAADTAAALLGAGLSVGETQLSTGTGGQLARLVGRPGADPTGRTHLYRATGDHWYAMAAIQNAGIAIDWAVGLLGAEPAEIDGAMTAPRSGGEPVFHPYLTGERTPHLDATLTGRWTGLRPTTTRAELLRSVFDGVALALRDGLDALRAAGHPVRSALLAGGGSTAPWWRQLLADALELPLTPHDAVDASVRGAGLLAMEAVGHTIDPAAAVSRGGPIEPLPEGVAALAAVRERFRALPGPERPARW
jgi:xylulokinase